MASKLIDRPATVVITGASSGIGEATARLLDRSWKAPLKLLLTARREDRLLALKRELKNETKIFAFDVRSRAAVEEFQKTIASEKISVLINNAGLAAGLESLQEANLEDWEAMIDTNLKGLLYMSRALLPSLIENKGHVVNLGSVAGRTVYPKGGVYCATKFAVRALNEAMRIDTVGTGLRVSSIDPGMVETEFSLVRFAGDTKRAGAVYQGLTPLSAEDVADSILWCLSRPAHVNVQEILLMPTDQASPRDVNRKS